MTPTKALSVHVLVDVHVLPCISPAFAETFFANLTCGLPMCPIFNSAFW